MSPVPVGDHIPMHVWATLTELNGLSREEEDMRLGECYGGALKREHRGTCDHISLSASMKFSRIAINFKNCNFLKNKIHISPHRKDSAF